MSQAQQRDRGRNRLRCAHRPGARRRSHPVHRRPERALRRCRDVPRRVPLVLVVRAAAKARRRRRVAARRPRRASASSSRTRCSRRWPRLVVVFGFLGAGMSAGLPVYAYDEFDGSAWIAGLFYAALGAGALVGSLARRLRRQEDRRRFGSAASAILAFAVPLWVLPFLPPWPVVFLALFVGDVLHAARQRAHSRRADGTDARGPPGQVMTAVISVEHARGATRLPRRRAGARALGGRAAVHRRRPRDHVDGDRLRRDRWRHTRRRGRARARRHVERPPARDGVSRRRSEPPPYLRQVA